MKKMFNEENQIHNFMSSSGSGSVINYGSGSGSDFLTSYGFGYGSGSTSQKVTVPTVPVPVPVPQHCLQDRACTDFFENFSENTLKGDLSNATIFNPPLFSLLGTFKSNSFLMLSGN